MKDTSSAQLNKHTLTCTEPFVSDHHALDPCHHQRQLIAVSSSSLSFLSVRPFILRCEHDICLVEMAASSAAATSASCSAAEASAACCLAVVAACLGKLLYSTAFCWSACERHEQQPTQQHQQPRSYETRHHLPFSGIMKESLGKI